MTISSNAVTRRSLSLAAVGALGAVAGLGVAPAVAAHPSSQRAPAPVTSGAGAAVAWGKPVFVDDFKETKLVSRYWSDPYDAPTKSPNPTWGKNVRVARGQLMLTGAVDGPPGPDGKPLDVGAGLASKLDQLYGRWEVRLRVDAGKGYSGVSTLWPKSDKWPDDGEVDVVEIPNPKRSSANLFLHNATDQKEHKLKGDFTQWHVFAVEWTPTYVAYYLDGKLQWVVSDRAYVPKKAMHLTLQMDQSCAAYGHVCRDRTTPRYVVMHVDWVKIYKLPRK